MTKDQENLKKQFLLDGASPDPLEQLQAQISVVPDSDREPMLRESLRRQFRNKGRR